MDIDWIKSPPKRLIKGPCKLSRRKMSGNSTGGAHKGYAHLRRIYDRMDNTLTKRYWVVDTYATLKGIGPLAQTECLKYNHANAQVHSVATVSPANIHHRCTQPVPPGRFVHIPEIHPNLFLSDLASLSEWARQWQKKGPLMAINLSKCPVDGRRRKVWGSQVTVNITDVPIPDTPNVTFHDLHSAICQVKTVLHAHLSTCKVTLVCEKGVNRSVFMAVAYGLDVTMQPCTHLINYISEEKYKVSPTWNNLTNAKMRTILRQLESRRPRQQISHIHARGV